MDALYPVTFKGESLMSDEQYVVPDPIVDAKSVAR